MRINIEYPPPRLHRSVGTSLVADAFGITGGGEPLVIARELELPYDPGQRIAITGPSGSGKSSLLRAIGEELEGKELRVSRPDDEELSSRAVIDAIALPFAKAIGLLASCGLSEPALLMRSPAELSEGQRWRFRLARALSREPDWLLIDEFASTLDAALARVIATNLRRQSLRQRCGVVVATCHAGPITDFDPDIHIACDLDGDLAITKRKVGRTACVHSQTNSKSPAVPRRTGRISLAGITAPSGSARSE